jgi:hypothetical protein
MDRLKTLFTDILGDSPTVLFSETPSGEYLQRELLEMGHPTKLVTWSKTYALFGDDFLIVYGHDSDTEWWALSRKGERYDYSYQDLITVMRSL